MNLRIVLFVEMLVVGFDIDGEHFWLHRLNLLHFVKIGENLRGKAFLFVKEKFDLILHIFGMLSF